MKITRVWLHILNSIIPLYRNIVRAAFLGKNNSYALCFHDVSNDCSVYTIEPNCFFDIIEKVKESICDINSIKNGGVLITFDDGFESVFLVVLPFMERMNLPFTCYITTNFLNQPGYLSNDQLRRLSESKLCTIGSHMVSHRRTREMTPREVVEEWINSKSEIESIIGKEIHHAALPYGSILTCSFFSINCALKNGYRTVADTIASPFKSSSSIISRFVYQKNNTRVENLVKRI